MDTSITKKGDNQIEDSTEISMKIREWESKKALIIEKRKLVRDNSVRISRFAEYCDAMRRNGLSQRAIQNDPRIPEFLEEVLSFQSTQFEHIAELREEIAALEEALPQLKERALRAQAAAVKARRRELGNPCRCRSDALIEERPIERLD